MSVEAQERDDKGLKEGCRSGEDGLNLSAVLGEGLSCLAASVGLGREGTSPSSGPCVARRWLLAAGTDDAGGVGAGWFFRSAVLIEGPPQGSSSWKVVNGLQETVSLRRR